MELPIRHIVIGEQERAALQKDVWSDKFVKAFIVVRGRTEPVQLRYRGGHTREYPKKSYEIVRQGKTFHFNAEYDDPSMIRNALSFRFFRWIGVPCPMTRHCLLYLNGQSLGVYLEIEGVDRSFFARRGIAAQSLFYAVNDYADFGLLRPQSTERKRSLFQGYELVLGGQVEVQRWKAFILQLNTLKGWALGRYLLQRLDTDNYLRWLAGAVCTGNYDGFDQNYAVYRDKRSNKYRMIPWDYEGTWGRNCYGKPCGSDLVRVSGYNQLTRRLLTFPMFRKKYKSLLSTILRRHLKAEKIDPVVRLMYRGITQYIHADFSRRWSQSEFNGEPRMIRSYIAERRAIINKALKRL